VAALFVLPHLNDLAAGIAEARRVLRPGGRLVLTGWADPDQAPYTGLAGRLLQEFAADFERDALAEATRRTDPGYLADVVAAHGFDRPAVTTLATTVEEPSAVAWWRALAVGSSGFADLFSAQAPAVQRAVRSRFLAAAADYAGADGTLQVPVTAHLCAATAG
jgi:SAM-dependent methyltransferase